MVITYHGQNNFRISSGQTTLSIDPQNDRLKPILTIKTITNPDDISGDPSIINTAGEFDLNSIEVKGLELKTESTAKFIKNVFLVKGLDELRLVFLGHASSNLDKEIIEQLGVVDILFLAIGDHYLKAQDVEVIIKNITPKIAIIVSFDNDSFETLSKDFGKEIKSETKLNIKVKDLPDKGFEMILLEKS